MYIKKITLVAWALNFALVGMVGYVWGVHNGMNMTKSAVDPVAINYALYQAMQND